MKFLSQIGSALSFLPRRIDKKVEDEIADKTGVAVLAALQTLDGTLPVLTTLLNGGTVRAEISIRLIDTDGPSVKR